MSYTVIVKQHTPQPSSEIAARLPVTEQIFEQTVEVLDLNKLFAAVNSKPRKPRVTKPKSV
jgi:hypothetical protein